MKSFSREFKAVFFGLLILGLASTGIFYGYNWFSKKQVRVVNGIARPTFPYSDYNRDELETMYPQVANENVATTRTPEETHRMFVEKLKAGDLDGAVECCVAKAEIEEIKSLIDGVKKRGQMDLMLSDIMNIEKDLLGDTLATYIYSGTLDGEKVANFMQFTKNRDGIWLITSF